MAAKRGFSLARESALTFAARGVSFVVSVATSIVVARALGPSLKGAYNLVILILGAVSLLLLFGLGSAAVYYGARDPSRLPELTGNAFIAGLVLGVLGLAITELLTLNPTFQAYLKDNNISLLLLRRVAFLIPVMQMQAYLQEMLRAAGKIVAYNLVGIAQALAGLLAALVFVLVLRLQLEGALLAWAVATTATFLVTAVLALQATDRRIGVNLQVLLESLTYGIRLYPGNIAQFFNYRLSVFLIGAFLSSQEIGWYVTGTSLVERIWEIPHAIRTALLYQVAANKQPESSHQATARANRMMLGLLALICAFMALISSPLVRLMYGDAFTPAVPIVQVLLPGVWALSSSKLLAAHLAGTGRPEVGTIGALVSLIATAALNLLLIPPLGILGSAIATSVAYALSSLVIIVAFLGASKLTLLEALVPQPADLKALSNALTRMMKKQASLDGRGR